MIFLITKTLDILLPDHREDSGMDSELVGESLPHLWRSLYSEEKEKVRREEAVTRLWVDSVCISRRTSLHILPLQKLLPLL